MDRSFLSDASVIAASRRWICVRLLTYESADEAKLLTSFFVGRSGQLENTTFALLDPEGKTKLARAGRSPDFAFRGGAGKSPADEMAQAMNELASSYETAATKTPSELPTCRTVRLGLDVASCDGLPLVVAFGDDAALRAALVARLATCAWGDGAVGRFVYAVASSSADLKAIDGVAGKSGLVLVEPDEFGLKGDALIETAIDADGDKIAKALADGLRRHHAVAKDARRHIQEGLRLGVHWETAIPVTDPGPPGGGPPPGGR